MSRLTAVIRKEIRELIPPLIFFFIFLHLVWFMRILMLKGTGLSVGTSLSVTLSALILAKAVLIADLLPVINRYPDKPLIYNVVWKTVIYVLIAMLIHYLERLYEFWREAGGFVAGNEKMLSEMVWSHFWAIQIFLTVMVFMYCAMHELARVIGENKVREIFFGLPPGASVASR